MEKETLNDYRLNAIERQITSHEEEIDELKEELQSIQNVHNERYRKLSVFNTRLDEGYKTMKDKVERLISQIDQLENKLDELREMYRKQIERTDAKYKEVMNKVDKHAAVSTESNDDGTYNVSKTFIGTVTLGVIGIIEVFVQYVAPILFK